ncbi:MAG: hypothetical protein EBR01_11800 [Proteobacteria bacterium]|nr:hypothetical protein [Pseudomonadota bacterium]
MMKTFLISLIASFFLPVALADNLNQEQKNALKEVMNQLTNPSARMEQLKNDKRAQDSDKAVKELGGEYSEEIYQLAAQIMENLVREAQGDPDKMMKILEKAQQNPSAFADTFSEEQKRKLKELGKKIEKRQGKLIH